MTSGVLNPLEDLSPDPGEVDAYLKRTKDRRNGEQFPGTSAVK
jgi:hypothetical protein